MGVLTESFNTIVTITRDLDGRIWNQETQTWEPATQESLLAADTAIGETISAMLDVVPFPLSLSIMGIIQFDVDRTSLENALFKVKDAIRNYVTATTSTTKV